MNVSQRIEWKIYTAPEVNVPSVFVWKPEDPLTVNITFVTEFGSSEWDIGRELLHDAIKYSHAGFQDVKITCVGDTLLLTLESPFGMQQLVTEASRVGQFLASTYGIVAHDAEVYDTDTVIAKILEETL